MAILVKKTNGDGTVQEVEFDSVVDGAKALGLLFGVELPGNVQRQVDIDNLNATLRQSWSRATTNPSEIFQQWQEGR